MFSKGLLWTVLIDVTAALRWQHSRDDFEGDIMMLLLVMNLTNCSNPRALYCTLPYGIVGSFLVIICYRSFSLC